MRAQLSLEFLCIISLVMASLVLLSNLSLKTETNDDQSSALLIDELSTFGSPFLSDALFAGEACHSHRIGNARTLTEKLLSMGEYRYVTHKIKSTTLS